MARIKTRQENLWAQLDPRPYTKYAQFHRQSNCQSSASLETTQSRNKYFLQFTTLGNLSNSLSQCCQMFAPSIYQYQNLEEQMRMKDRIVKDFNKIFEYACLIYFLQCKLLGEDQKCISHQQLESYDLQKQFFNSDKIQQAKQATLQFQLKSPHILSESIRTVKTLFTKQLTDTYNSLKQQGKPVKRKKIQKQHIFLIPVIEKVLQNIKQSTINQIMQIMQIEKDNPYMLNYLPQHTFKSSTKEQIEIYIKKILKQLFWAEFVMRELKIKKFKHCVRQEYRDYLKATFVNLKEGTKRLYNMKSTPNQCIMIKRYTFNKRDEVLITMKDLIQLQNDLAYQQQSNNLNQPKKLVNYKKEYFQVVKKLVSELALHNKITRNYYPLLSPSSILFNQLSLKINLNYQNIIYEGLGLLMKPKSIEHSICFSPTPQPFDTFTSPTQLESQNKIKMYHFLYGSDKYLPSQQQRLQPGDRASYEKQSLMKQSQCWRCLQSISYIMNNGKQYLDFNVKNRNKFDGFQKLVSLAQQKLKGKKWFQVLGKDFVQMIKKQRVSDIPQHYDFQKGTSFLDSLFHSEDNDYSIVEDNQFNNIIKRINIQLNLWKEIVKLLEDKTYFETISNSVKYLIRFYLNLYFQFSHILSLCRYYKNGQFAKGIILQRELSQKLSLLKERKQGYIEQSLKKFREYETKNKSTPVIHLQQTISNFNEQYNQLFYLFDLYEKITKNLVELDIDKSHQEKRQMQKFYQDQIEKLATEVANYVPRIKEYCRNIIEKEFMKHLRKKQKIIGNQPSKTSKIQMESNIIKYALLNIQVKTSIFLLSQDKFEKNFENIYALFQPTLAIDQNLPADEQERLSFFKQKISILEYLQDILRSIQSKDKAL